MAKKILNNKGFLIIGMNLTDAVKCEFGYLNDVVCDDCYKQLDDNLLFYYVAVLDELLCKECYDNWMSYAIHYDEDKECEKENYNKYAKILNLPIKL